MTTRKQLESRILLNITRIKQLKERIRVATEVINDSEEKIEEAIYSNELAREQISKMEATENQ